MSQNFNRPLMPTAIAATEAAQETALEIVLGQQAVLARHALMAVAVGIASEVAKELPQAEDGDIYGGVLFSKEYGIPSFSSKRNQMQ